MRRKLILGAAVLVTSLAATATPASAAAPKMQTAAPRVQTGGPNAITYGSDGYCAIVYAGSVGRINGQPNGATDPADTVQGRFGWQACRDGSSMNPYPVAVHAQLSLQNNTNGQHITQEVWENLGYGPTSFCDGGPPGQWTYGYSCVQTQASITCLPRNGASNWYAGMTYQYLMSDGSLTGWKPLNDWQNHTCRA